jgi:hypothetical protein
MIIMNRFVVIIFLAVNFLVVLASLARDGSLAQAQIIPPGTSPLNPLPPPLPGPKIQVPVVPKLDELPSRNYMPGPRPSFSDKVNTCLGEAAGGGLGPGDRDTYVRSCVNSR